MFEGIIREVVEETGIPSSSLVSQKFFPWLHFLFCCNFDLPEGSTVFPIIFKPFDGISDQCVFLIQSDPVFIGCSRRKQNVRPAAFFYVGSALSSAQVLHNYQHAEHTYESTALYTLTPVRAGESNPSYRNRPGISSIKPGYCCSN